MEKSRLSAYLDLIQKLLTCPHGEEWIYLKHYESLVDAEFLQVMEQVAMQIDQEGDPNAATFLHNWAAKLHHILLKEIKPTAPEEDRSDAYLELIQQLLICPEGLEEQLLIAHETLIGPGLVHTMRKVSKQLRQQDKNESAQYLESMASELSQAWLQEHKFSSNLQKAPVNQAPAPVKKTAPVKNTDDPWSSTTDAATTDAATTPTVAQSSSMSSAVQSPPVQAESAESTIPRSNVEAVPERSMTDGMAASSAATTSPTERVSQPLHKISDQQAIADGLQAIAQALQQLNHTLKLQRSQNPLQHLAVLEQACTAEWQLTTEEIEQLLGIKPKCHGHETTYRRGEWCFTKVGKVGSQTAWQVTKVSRQKLGLIKAPS